MINKLSDKILAALNAQATQEHLNSFVYLAISCCCSNKNLLGFAKYFYQQSCDEREHGMKIAEYILSQSCPVIIGDIQSVKSSWNNIQEIFAAVLNQEQQNTALINNVVKLADIEGDNATCNFLQWFVDEQVSEEREAGVMLAKVKMIETDNGSLLAMDHELGEESGEDMNVNLQLE
jgi:ferritin